MKHRPIVTFPPPNMPQGFCDLETLEEQIEFLRQSASETENEYLNKRWMWYASKFSRLIRRAE